jgi:double-strand break repair protein AddB
MELVRGLRDRLTGQPPEAMAQVQLFVNTRRMARRVTDILTESGAGFLPRIRLVTDLAPEAALAGIPPAVSPLRRRLELTQLVSRLLDAAPDLAPRTALYDLADSLAGLMDEMQGEGVDPDVIATLDVSNHSAHWTRTQAFMRILRPFFSTEEAPDPEARRRRVVEGLAEHWKAATPPDPVIVAGSTASRGTTLRFMRAVADLPQGALILPGYDFALPDAIWDGMADALTAEDHPQYRFRRLLDTLGRKPDEVLRWTETQPPHSRRNALVSLSLRPAPVTDQWLVEGQAFKDLPEATADLTLIEAENLRKEALAIALILRKAAEDGRRAALITPDRNLTRRVSTALDRWGIRPDDSAGRPLALSAPGRLLRHVTGLFGRKLTADALLIVLKHPLAASSAGRGTHLRLTRDLELHLRRHGPPFPDMAMLRSWAAAKGDPMAPDWAEWIATVFPPAAAADRAPLGDLLDLHLSLAETLARGPWGDGSGELWEKAAGEAAKVSVTALRDESSAGGSFDVSDYRNLFDAILNRGEVREEATVHPDIMIWGTLEARVQGADLVILGGLNDGSWPQLPSPDPWLNRRMRKDAGLLLPDRSIGLAAHDYQQAIAAKEVVLTRALRDADSETVPSRWLGRLTNLLDGLPGGGGPEALAAMRQRGTGWIALADRIEQPAERAQPAHRPAPRPPAAHRPKELALTRISTLIRDPYAIYARYILRLRKLDPLHRDPDVRLRGSVLHLVLERFVTERGQTDEAEAARLIRIAKEVLVQEVPWPAARLIWLARIARAAEFFIRHDSADGGVPASLEKRGSIKLAPLDFVLSGTPDRIDLLPDGRLHIIDYKTGSPPTKKQQEQFDKQLLLAAGMAERGAFPDIGAAEVARITYVGLGTNPKLETAPLTSAEIDRVWEGLVRLIRRYDLAETGYTARRAVFSSRFPGDYDHLSRFGEWEMTDRATPEDVR